MAITINIYNNTTKTRKTVSVDFFANLVAPIQGSPDALPKYYLKVFTAARDTDSLPIPPQMVNSLEDLVLNNQKRRITNSAAPYSDIREMIEDYVFDFVHGHTANLYGSGCTARSPMQF